MNIGWSGSRNALPCDEWLVNQAVEEYCGQGHTFITGGCVGIDAMVAEAAFRRGERVHTIIPSNLSLVDPWFLCRCTTYEYMAQDSTYRDRNLRIVESSDLLVAIPESASNQRTGTWQTINLAQKAGLEVVVYTLELARIAWDNRGH